MDDKNPFPERKSEMALIHVDPAALAAAEAAKARIQAAYIMALQRPRRELDARDRILTACKRSEFAGRAEFSRPMGKKKDENGRWVDNYVKGPSIRFAELALREWGNIISEAQVLYEDDDVRRVRVSVLDLESNAQFTKDIQLRKTIERRSKKGREDDVIGERKNSYNETVYILHATDDELYVKEAAWVSKVLRNEGLRLIPTDIIEEGMRVARQTAAKQVYQDPEAEKKRLVDAFSSIGVRPAELERYLGHKLDTISPAELVNLRTVYQSIRDNESAWTDYVENQNAAASGGRKKATQGTVSNGEQPKADPPQNGYAGKKVEDPKKTAAPEPEPPPAAEPDIERTSGPLGEVFIGEPPPQAEEPVVPLREQLLKMMGDAAPMLDLYEVHYKGVTKKPIDDAFYSKALAAGDEFTAIVERWAKDGTQKALEKVAAEPQSLRDRLIAQLGDLGPHLEAYEEYYKEVAKRPVDNNFYTQALAQIDGFRVTLNAWNQARKAKEKEAAKKTRASSRPNPPQPTTPAAEQTAPPADTAGPKITEYEYYKNMRGSKNGVNETKKGFRGFLVQNKQAFLDAGLNAIEPARAKYKDVYKTEFGFPLDPEEPQPQAEQAPDTAAAAPAKKDPWDASVPVDPLAQQKRELYRQYASKSSQQPKIAGYALKNKGLVDKPVEEWTIADFDGVLAEIDELVELSRKVGGELDDFETF